MVVMAGNNRTFLKERDGGEDKGQSNEVLPLGLCKGGLLPSLAIEDTDFIEFVLYYLRFLAQPQALSPHSKLFAVSSHL